MVKLATFRDDPIPVSSLRPGDIVQEGNRFRLIVSVTHSPYALNGSRALLIVWLVAGRLSGPISYVWNARLPLRTFRGLFAL